MKNYLTSRGKNFKKERFVVAVAYVYERDFMGYMAQAVGQLPIPATGGSVGTKSSVVRRFRVPLGNLL